MTPDTPLGWLLSKQPKTNVGTDVDKLESLSTVSGNVTWCSCYGKHKLITELPYHPAFTLLDIYPKELKAESTKNICTAMFMAAIFTIAKRW